MIRKSLIHRPILKRCIINYQLYSITLYGIMNCVPIQPQRWEIWEVKNTRKCYFGRKKNVFTLAKQAFFRSMTNAYRDRKARKRDFRRLWIVRINAAARLNGLTYSLLMNGLKQAGIEINRKMLSDVAINDMLAFAKLVDRAKEALQK